MKGKVIWLLASCVVVLSLVLAACAPAAPPVEKAPAAPAEVKPAAPAGGELVPAQKEAVAAEGGEGMFKWTGKKLDGTVVEKWVEKAKYGGVFTHSIERDAGNFDPADGGDFGSPALTMVYDSLGLGDWARGAAGTGETTHMDALWPLFELETGSLATWEFVDDTTLIYHVRQGVRWHNKPPANGRELTAEDVAFSLKRSWQNSRNYLGGNLPFDSTFDSITTPDKYTVVIKTQPPIDNVGMAVRIMNGLVLIYPPDPIKKYGDLRDWRNNLGTGPFMLTDYGISSYWTLVRNPNYWMKDPIQPENTLPYLDGVKVLVIPDLSTRISALRTSKIDVLHGTSTPLLQEEDAKSLMKTAPELKWRATQGSRTMMFFWRVDRKPFTDIRVRRALVMATDREAIRDGFYDGKGSLIMEPVPDIPEYQYAYTPLEQLPKSVQELYTYNPEKAKQLLAEAGYPNGFKTSIITGAIDVDLLSVIKDQWAKVGVELAIDVRETGALSGIFNNMLHDQMAAGLTAAGTPFSFSRIMPGVQQNKGAITDPRINEARMALADVYLKVKDPAERRAKLAPIIKEFTAYYLDQAYTLLMPGSLGYNFWQPWVKGYHGESYLGYYLPFKYVPMTWIDVDLKEKMTGRR